MNESTAEFLPAERVYEAWPVAEEAPRRALTLGDVAALCWRRRIPALVVASVVTLLVIAATLRITPLYEARAQLEIAPSAKVIDFQAGGDAPHIDYTLVNTVKERLLATPVLERALAQSSLHDGPAYAPGRREPADILRKRVRVTTSRDSWMIQVALRDEDAQRAKDGLAALVAAYYELMRERDTSSSSTALDFLRARVGESTTLYEQAREAEEAFRAANGITSADPEDNPYGRRLVELERARIGLAAQGSALAAVAIQIAGAQSEPGGGRLDRMLAIESIARNPEVAVQREQMAKAQADLAVLKREYGARHPRLQEAAEQVAVRQGQLETAVGQAAAAVAVGREELALQQEVIEKRIAAEEADLARYRAGLSRMQALSQETETRGRLLEELRRRLAEQEVTSRIETSQVAVASPPEAASRPANIYPSLFLAAGVFLGACSGVAAALVTERVDRRLRGEVALRAASAAPQLAAIPAIATGVQRLAVARDPDHPAELAESFETLRMSLRLTTQYRDASAAGHGCCLVITGAGPREGCSTVASRLAVSLAATGSRVLLVDADLRRPSLHEQFGEPRAGGFSLLLAGEQQHAVHTRFPRLDLLCAGQRPPHPADLLHSPVLSWYIGEARRRYDWILFDTPPVSRFADALVIGEHADGAVLVARDGVALRDAVADSAHRLRRLGRKLVGTVLTAARELGAGTAIATGTAPADHALVGALS